MFCLTLNMSGEALKKQPTHLSASASVQSPTHTNEQTHAFHFIEAVQHFQRIIWLSSNFEVCQLLNPFLVNTNKSHVSVFLYQEYHPSNLSLYSRRLTTTQGISHCTEIHLNKIT